MSAALRDLYQRPCGPVGITVEWFGEVHIPYHSLDSCVLINFVAQTVFHPPDDITGNHLALGVIHQEVVHTGIDAQALVLCTCLLIEVDGILWSDRRIMITIQNQD